MIKQPSIFLVISTLVIIVGIPYGIYGLTLDGGSSLGGVLILVGVFVAIIVLILDRLLAKTEISLLKLNISESIILCLIIIFYSFSQRRMVMKPMNEKAEYFVIIENNGDLANSNFHYKLPFSQVLETSKNNAVINSISKNYQRIEINSPKRWQSLKMTPEEIDSIKVQFWCNGDREFDQTAIDSIIRKEIQTAGNTG